MRRLWLLLFSLFLAVGWANAQSGQFLISPAAASFQNQSVRGFWSLGEITAGSSQVDGVVVSQGFTKSTLINTITSIDEEGAGHYRVFPNPVEDFLIINSINDNLSQVTFRLYDTKGQLVELKDFTNNPFSTRISMTGLSKGVYVLIVDGPHFKVPIKFKIYKTHE